MTSLNFKAKFDYGKRCEASQNVKKQYPNRLPCIVEAYKKNDPPTTKYKYLAPRDISLSKLMIEIRKNVVIDEGLSIIFMINNMIIPSTRTMEDIYNRYVDDDGFLYIIYTCESTFG